MISETEKLISNQSYLKKDFYQIYPEILDLVSKISKRWDPSSSNESDPGVVLLKLLAFIADKNNYNIDKNILECFMPSCTQEQSMRKLCDMMGYDMKYYTSAVTDVVLTYKGNLFKNANDTDKITFRPFETVFTNEQEDIKFVMIPLPDKDNNTYKNTLMTNELTINVQAIEGEKVELQIGEDNIVKLNNLDDNNRLYLPEPNIAENGIFIKLHDEDDTGWSLWHKVPNLNLAEVGSRVYTFGFDSRDRLPYIQFPDDIANLIGDGLDIIYIRTSGAEGNIAANVLTKLQGITDLHLDSDSENTEKIYDDNKSTVLISNLYATKNGKDKETIDEAYNNFKKTVCTFDTLVTCRDYANAIYKLVSDSNSNNPLVSNCQVGDVRCDLNGGINYITFDESNITGYKYKNKATDNINHFDLMIYPLNVYKPTTKYKTNVNNYKEAYKPSTNLTPITDGIEDYKTIAHDIKQYKNQDDLYLIKNLVKLNAKITTTYKVGAYEESLILDNIKNALLEKFNPRNLDYGEPIPYDELLNCIENADERIKNVILDEPDLETAFTYADGSSYTARTDDGTNKFKNTYYDLVVKNVTAGKAPLFNYSKGLEYSFGQSLAEDAGPLYGNGKYTIIPTKSNPITKIETQSEITLNSDYYTLRDNELIQIISPNYLTDTSYGVGVAYEYTGNDTLEANKINTLSGSLTLSWTNAEGIREEKIFNDGAYIQPNFDIEPGDNGSLMSDEEILYKIKSTVVLDSKFYCYWLTLDGKLEFVNGEHLLINDEYFFYTNEERTELATLGPGTLLKYNGTEFPQLDYKKEVEVDIEDIMINGLSAVDTSKWEELDFTSNNLTIEEQSITTLVKNDKIKLTTTQVLNNNFESVAGGSFEYKFDAADKSVKSVDGVNYKIRSGLILNIGPNKGQTLLKNQSITLLRKLYKSKHGSILQNPINIDNIGIETEEEIIDTLENVTVRCNYNLYTINPELATTISSADESEYINNLEIFAYSNEGITVNDQKVSMDKGYLMVERPEGEVEGVAQLPIAFDNTNKYGIFMLYAISRQEEGNEVILEGNYEIFDSEDSNLSEGLNIIKVNVGNELTVRCTGDAKAIITNIKVVDFDSNNPDGLNTNLILNYIEGMDISDDSVLILNKLKALDIEFFYTADLDNDLLINIDSFSNPEVWYDYNNIFNKFVMNQLDFNSLDNNIQLTKSSKL